MKRVWPDSFVEEANLSVHMSALRRALGEAANEHRYVETVPGVGYRFVAGVRERSDDGVDLYAHELSDEHDGNPPLISDLAFRVVGSQLNDRSAGALASLRCGVPLDVNSAIAFVVFSAPDTGLGVESAFAAGNE